MASTRNKNSLFNYNLEQENNVFSNNYLLYEHASSGKSYTNNFAGNGLLHGRMHSNLLSTNSTDIESMLYGINSTNLENPQNNNLHNINIIQHKHLNLFDRQQQLMPDNLLLDITQRPGHYENK
jgi:hypothetical protein